MFLNSGKSGRLQLIKITMVLMMLWNPLASAIDITTFIDYMNAWYPENPDFAMNACSWEKLVNYRNYVINVIKGGGVNAEIALKNLQNLNMQALAAFEAAYIASLKAAPPVVGTVVSEGGGAAATGGGLYGSGSTVGYLIPAVATGTTVLVTMSPTQLGTDDEDVEGYQERMRQLKEEEEARLRLIEATLARKRELAEQKYYENMARWQTNQVIPIVPSITPNYYRDANGNLIPILPPTDAEGNLIPKPIETQE